MFEAGFYMTKEIGRCYSEGGWREVGERRLGVGGCWAVAGEELDYRCLFGRRHRFFL